MSGHTTPVRVGIVGLGNIGHYHADRIVDLGHAVVGGADINAEARARFRSTYDADTYESYDQLYREAAFDAVVVTTPNKFHEECAIAALEAGHDVLLEKPLAHTLESARRIAEAAERAEGFCMVGFNNRFANGVEVFKSHQSEGRFGEVAHVEANYIRRRGIPGRGSWFTSREVSGGGALIDIGVHAVDLALYFMDFPEVREVSGTVRSQFGSRDDYAFLEMWGDDVGPTGFDVGDSATAFIRCADGRTISLEVAWAANRESDETFVVRGTEAGARFDLDDGSLHIFETGKGGADHFADTTVTTRINDTHKSEQTTFLEAVARDEPPGRNTVEQAMAVQEVIDAIYRSNEAGRAVEIERGEHVARMD
jgi:predicted dehydrogenase